MISSTFLKLETAQCGRMRWKQLDSLVATHILVEILKITTLLGDSLSLKHLAPHRASRESFVESWIDFGCANLLVDMANIWLFAGGH